MRALAVALTLVALTALAAAPTASAGDPDCPDPDDEVGCVLHTASGVVGGFLDRVTQAWEDFRKAHLCYYFTEYETCII